MYHKNASYGPPDADRTREQLLSELREMKAEISALKKARDADSAGHVSGEGEEWFRAVFESIHDIILILRSDGRIIEANRAAVEALGYSKEELLRMGASELRPPSEKPKVAEQLEMGRKGAIFETRYMRKDGSEFPVEVSTRAAVLDGETAILGIIRNISERRRAEEALRATEERFRATFEQAAVGMTHVSRDGRFLRVNRKFCDITGYGPTELVKMNVRDITYGPDMAGEERLIERILAGEIDTYSWEKRYVRKDGGIAWINLTVTPIYGDEKLQYLMGVTEDITRRKQAEKDLRLTQFSMDRSADMALWVAPDARFIYVNDAACRAFGYTREEFLSQRAFDTNPYFNEKNWGDHWKAVKERGSFTFEARLRRKDGTFFDGEITANYLFYDGKEYNCSFIRDITHRKRAEAELKEAKAEAELYLDLMAHDINNMNQIAMGYLELAQGTLEYEGRLDRDDALLLSKPVDTLRSASTLIDNVRKLQREKAGHYAPSRIDLDGLLQDVKRHYSAVPGRDVAIDYEPCGGCTVQANELLRDVFVNLVGNAIKHSDSAKKLAVGIRVEKISDDEWEHCKVSVEDNGPGIPDELKATLFDRLNLTATRAKGKGFGLCLIKLLVDDYGGKFWVEDRVPGDHTKGARFVVQLPAVESEQR